METRWKSCSDMLYLWCLNKLMHHQFGKFIHTSASHTCYQPRAWTWLGRTPSPAPITESDLVYHTGRHETQPSCGFTSSQNPYILHINSKSATPVVFKANYVWKPETQFTYHPKIFARPLELLESLVVYVSGWHASCACCAFPKRHNGPHVQKVSRLFPSWLNENNDAYACICAGMFPTNGLNARHAWISLLQL